MNRDFNNIIHSMFRNKYDRRGNNIEFKPYFYRFIGVENAENYNNLLKTIETKAEEFNDKTLVFDNEISLNGEMELIEYIYNELNNMDVFNISREDITILNNAEANSVFLKALEYIVKLSVSNENFFSDSVRNNFITKLIVWSYSYLKDIDFEGDLNPKCIYYGNISRQEIYFLTMLHLMSFDVIYINPLKEEYFEEVDKDSLSILIKGMSILEIQSFKERSKVGRVVEVNETLTKSIQRDVREELFSNTGMYVPWQFRGGYTKSVLLSGIVEDLEIYLNEPAKLRPGFKTSNTTVKVPCFFYKVDGEYLDNNKYQELVNKCVNSQSTLFFNSGLISQDARVTDDMYQLMFCQLSDGTFDIEEIKKLPIYKFSKYSDEVQNLILNKFNEAILEKDLFNINFDKDRTLKLLVLIISMNENIVRIIDNFDFTSSVPKVVIYLNGEESINESIVMLLGYLHLIGIDIVIFNPSGLCNIRKIIKEDRIIITRLEQMNYESKYRKLEFRGSSILKRIFK
ncbi:YceG family protein [Clostridium sp.]|uniref:YceG family protein n=1 Tax=Clostridium sp. TaxID=1506 RepID=UPI002FC58360